MSKFINKPKTNHNLREKYSKYNLKDNPFPYDPFMEPESDNVRVNGSIYNDKIKQKEIFKISSNFFNQNIDGNHRRLGYLVDASFTGRGNGKSALLVHLQKLVNNDFGFTVSNGENRTFAIYVKPQPGGRNSKFWQFVELAMLQIKKQNLLLDSFITIKYNAIVSIEGNLEKIEGKLNDDDDFKKLLESSFYEENNIDEQKVISVVRQTLLDKGLQNNVINEIVFYPININQLLIDRVLQQPESVKKKSLANYFFNDIVRFFIAANFNGAYILLDEFEKIVDSQSSAERNDFAAELRHYLFEGGGIGAVTGFFISIMAMHPGVPNILKESWEKSGLSARSPLPSNKMEDELHIIFFNNLQKENIKDLLIEYLNYFRLDKNDVNHVGIFPFENEVVEKMAELSNFNTAKTLKLASILLDECVKRDMKIIDIDLLDKFNAEKINNPLENITSQDFLARDKSYIQDIFKGIELKK